ncbi:hypothetical protein [Altericroceibacterium spongiae]|uniref:thiolase family protein n=1 Tax=Altericroceibacterium spongiae TaxID=2320269 RepID=UPI003B75BF52
MGKAYRGAFNDTQPQALAVHAISHAVSRAGLEPGDVEDLVWGCALQQGSTSSNIARQAAIRAGMPTSVAGMSIDRQCASGLMAVATAAKQIVHDGMDIAVAGAIARLGVLLDKGTTRGFYAADDVRPYTCPHPDRRGSGRLFRL